MAGQGPMIVRLNLEGTHHVGSARLADLGVKPHEADSYVRRPGPS